MMDVLFTVDTEAYPLRAAWREEQLLQDLRRDIYGETREGVFGLDYQLGVLNAFQLKGVFFVESLLAEAIGFDALKRVVQRIEEAGHEVQLHVHPEWLAWASRAPFAARGPQVLRQLSLEEQTDAIGLALRNLRDAGASKVCAFRAGDFAANAHTLTALVRCGVRYDSSYNCCYSHSFDDVGELSGCVQPMTVRGVREVPIAWWQARPQGPRPAQITASSHAELAGALLSAWRAGWKTFVIVFHTFELLKKRRQRIEQPVPDWLTVRRFLRLCRFLDEHRDKFRACGFADLGERSEQGSDNSNSLHPISSPVHRTAQRWIEQGYRRIR